jgi:asparagine synthase (glutamine-hydrolysing)
MSGFVGFSGKFDRAEDIARAMLGRIAHRGPDSQSMYLGDLMTLGFRGLTVSSGCLRGPVMNEDKTLVLVLDGQIYNADNLREMLTGRGHVFSTDADSEVVLHMYEEYGAGLVSHLVGAFAFVIYDMMEDSLFAARDPFGARPLYYFTTEGEIGVASEAKAFMEYPEFAPVVNAEALAQYLHFGSNPLAASFFRGVYKLMPGHHMMFEGGQLTVSRYYSPMFTPQDMNLEQAAEMVDNVVTSSVVRHMGGEAPVGVITDGGVNGEFLAAVMGTGCESRVNSEEISDKIAPQDFLAATTEIQYHMDEPTACPSAVPLYFSMHTAGEKARVVLHPAGADELFAGHDVYRSPIRTAGYRRLPLGLRRWLGARIKRLRNGAYELESYYFGAFAGVFSVSELQQILKTGPLKFPCEITRPYFDRVRYEDDITKMQCLDIAVQLPTLAATVDKLAAAFGLGSRLPMSDREVLRVATRLPLRFRVASDETKIAFRRAASAHVSQEIAEATPPKPKNPLKIWLREPAFVKEMSRAFSSEAAEEFFYTDRVMALLQDPVGNSAKIWAIYCFIIWHEQFFHA